MQNNIKSLIFASSDLTPKKAFELKESDFEKYQNKDFFDMQKTFEKYNIFSFDRSNLWKLENCVSKPYFIFGIWNLKLLEKKSIGVVWPRQVDNYGEKITALLFENLSWYDIVSVSGMAPWVDQLAHENSIKNNIPTIAILWGWIWYFLKNQKSWIDKILDSWGLILSEYKPLSSPTKFSFPQRNRIIACISEILFIPQAWKKSWSLITADFAHKMWKKIFGTPWDIFSPLSSGLNEYLQYGIISPVSDLEYFVKTYFWEKNYSQILIRDNNRENYWQAKKTEEKNTENFDFSEDEKNILKVFDTKNNISSLELQDVLWWDFSRILLTITTLQIKNMLQEIYPGIFSKKN